MELFALGSLGRHLVVCKLEQDTEVKWSTFWVENSTQLLLEIWLIFFTSELELSGIISSRLRLSFSSSSEDTVLLGSKEWWTLAVLCLSLQEAEEDRWWDKVQKEDPAKIEDKRGTGFSREVESGDDTDKVEKEDVPSEVVETKMYKWERKIMQIQMRVEPKIIL